MIYRIRIEGNGYEDIFDLKIDVERDVIDLIISDTLYNLRNAMTVQAMPEFIKAGRDDGITTLPGEHFTNTKASQS